MIPFLSVTPGKTLEIHGQRKPLGAAKLPAACGSTDGTEMSPRALQAGATCKLQQQNPTSLLTVKPVQEPSTAQQGPVRPCKPFTRSCSSHPALHLLRDAQNYTRQQFDFLIISITVTKTLQSEQNKEKSPLSF